MINFKTYKKLHKKIEDKLIEISKVYCSLKAKGYSYEDFEIDEVRGEDIIYVTLSNIFPSCGFDSASFYIFVKDINLPISKFEEIWREEEEEFERKKREKLKIEKEMDDVRREERDKNEYWRLKRKYKNLN